MRNAFSRACCGDDGHGPLTPGSRTLSLAAGWEVELADGSKSVYKGVVIAVGYEAMIRAMKFHTNSPC
jgi:hypothetical protein